MYVDDWVDVDGLSDGITEFTWTGDRMPDAVDEEGALVIVWRGGNRKRREPIEYVWYLRMRAAANHWDQRLFDAIYEASRVPRDVLASKSSSIEALHDILKASTYDTTERAVRGAYQTFTAAINANRDIGDVWGDDAYYAAAYIAWAEHQSQAPMTASALAENTDSFTRDDVLEAYSVLFDPVEPGLLRAVASEAQLPDASPQMEGVRPTAVPPTATEEE